jgi:hypothetical protein
MANDRAGADDGPGPNSQARQDRRANSQKSTVLDLYVASEVNAGCNVRMVTDRVVMIHRAARVENGVRTNSRAGIHYCASNDHGARADRHVCRYHCAGMHYREKLFASERKHSKQRFSSSVVTHCDDDSVVRKVAEFVDSTNDGSPKKTGTLKFLPIINEALNQSSGWLR